MSGFGIRFLISNLFIMLFISILMLAKRLLQGRITEQAQYAMNFSFLALLIIPFLPLESPDFLNLLAGLSSRAGAVAPAAEGISRAGASASAESTWIRDFAVSVDSRTSSTAGMILIAIWLLGAAVMGVLALLIEEKPHTHGVGDEQSGQNNEKGGGGQAFFHGRRTLLSRSCTPRPGRWR